MQSENCSIYDDLGGVGYKIVQETHKWNRDHSNDRSIIQSLVLKKTFESISFERLDEIFKSNGELEALVCKIVVVPTDMNPGEVP